MSALPVSVPPASEGAARHYGPPPPSADNYQPSHSAAVNYGSSPPSAKVSLATWWEKFKKKPAAAKEGGDKDHPPGIFGVPLSKSIKYANVAISLTDANGEQFIYGYIPIVVAKCGVFLKEKATNIEGIFRLSGSAKRIKDLQTIFNSPDKYGKGLDWTGYTVHDAANIFRRYLNQLPEPIIPLDFYARFREPLQCAPEHFDAHAAIQAYQDLIGKLPALNRQLLLYILDLLAVFASKSEHNLMNASNLAAIFQPGLINHPEHDMSPSDYKLSQDVLVFLITNQDHFLLGMRGNAESEAIDNLNVPMASASPASPRRSKTVVSRSPSTSSAGADDVRKFGNLRRNVSVTSRRSTAGSPVTASSGSGLSRSNTVPSKRSPTSPVNLRGGDFTSTPGSPRSLAEKNSVARSPSIGGRVRENVTPVSTTSDESVKTLKAISSPPRTAPPPQVISIESPPMQTQPVTTPTKERNFANFFSGLSPESHDRLQKPGNKLRKKRNPGSANHSAESSTTNLPEGNTINTLAQNGYGPPPTSHSSIGGETLVPTPQSSHMTATTSMLHYFGISQQGAAPHSAASSATLMPAMSPTPSTTSSVTSQSSSHENSDTTNPSSSPEKKKRSRWRLSGRVYDDPPTSPTFTNGHASTGSLAERIRQVSRSPPHRTRSVSGETSGMSDGEERRSAFGWLSKKVNGKTPQQCEKEREQREHERSRGRREEMHVQIDNLPRLPMPPPPMPGSPRVQPPTPSSGTLSTLVQGHPESPREREANPFWRDRPAKQRDVPMHTPRTSEEKERHKPNSPDRPLYAPVPGESIEPESQIQSRRRPQAIRPGEPISLQGIPGVPSQGMPQGMLQRIPQGMNQRISQGLPHGMRHGQMSPPGTAL